MEWADARTWRSVLAAPDESNAEFVDRLYHIHFTQRAFLHLWTGEPRLEYDPKRFQTRAELCAWARPYYARVMAFLQPDIVRRLPEPLVVPWAKLYQSQLGRAPASTTFGETVFQV